MDDGWVKRGVGGADANGEPAGDLPAKDGTQNGGWTVSTHLRTALLSAYMERSVSGREGTAVGNRNTSYCAIWRYIAYLRAATLREVS